MNIEELHKKILYPIVRVRAENAGGTGICIYSKPVPKESKKFRKDREVYETYLLTAEHVVNDCIKIDKRWDSVLKREIRKEILSRLRIEFFDYVDLSTPVSSNEHDAEIIAYDKEGDIALLKVDTPRKAEYVASLLPRDKVGSLRLFHKVWASGCSLGHPPIPMEGRITSLREDIEDRNYFMYSAHTIFGNSGGAVYTTDGDLIGISARITAMQLGFGIDVMTWMGFMVPVDRIYRFFDEQCLQFIYDPAYTSEQCFKARAKKQEEWKHKLLKEEAEVGA